jgi:hypothetical protein
VRVDGWRKVVMAVTLARADVVGAGPKSQAAKLKGSCGSGGITKKGGLTMGVVVAAWHHPRWVVMVMVWGRMGGGKWMAASGRGRDPGSRKPRCC